MSTHILVIDEGTTSTRAIAYTRDLIPAATSQKEVPLTYPADGWVEQDGEMIWDHTLAVCKDVIAQIGGAENVAAIGITNQRETTLIWDRETGVPIAPAIGWQDRRTADVCNELKAAGHEARVQAETGLLLDPYFSGTKIGWLLDNVSGARAKAEAGALAFGTVDTFLIWKLTSGAVHASDVTNASRTLLYKLGLGAEGGWHDAMCTLLNVPQSLLPEVKPSAASYGETDPALFGCTIPIFSAIGDQQAATVGQACLAPGEAKITYGTGAFLVANTGDVRPASANRLLGTVCYEIAGGLGAMALEGSIFNAGTVVQWLRDEMGFMASSPESEVMAAALEDNGGVYIVPAFTGLGAPHWNADARGLISGLTRGTSAAHIVRAGLEAAAYQTADLLDAFAGDGAKVSLLRVDGGMTANDWLMQFIADVCDVTVERPDDQEMTALGAGALSAMQLGWISFDEWAARKAPGRLFSPQLPPAERARLRAGWAKAVERTLA